MISGSLSRKISRLPSVPDGLLDVDALAYIRQVETSLGARVAKKKRDAISAFVKAEKTAGRWTSIKRMYFPIWGVAAANAICMKSLTSGTFYGLVTHASGYVEPDGSTGYFDSGVAVNSILTTGSCGIFALVRDDVQFYTGGYGTAPYPGLLVGDTSATIIGQAPSDSSSLQAGVAGGGIILVSQTSATARGLYQRLTSGFSTRSTNTTNDTNALPALNMYFAGAFNNNGGPYCTGNRHGSYGLISGMNSTNSEGFTLSLKTLWETCTGLTLP